MYVHVYVCVRKTMKTSSGRSKKEAEYELRVWPDVSPVKASSVDSLQCGSSRTCKI